MGLKDSPRRPVGISVPSRKDPLLRRMTELVGGPMGRHAAPGLVRPAVFTVDRVLILLTTAAALLAVLVKYPCRTSGWVRPEQFYRACYSEWTEAFQFSGLGSGLFPFTEGSPFAGPVLLGVLAGIMALLVPTSPSGIVQTEAVGQYFDVNALLVTVAWVGTVLVTMRLASRRPWDAAVVAVAPIAILTATSSWTLIPVALSVLAVWAFAQQRYVVSGILLGLGTGFGVHVLLIYVAVLLLAVRTGRFRPALVAGGAFAVTRILTTLPFGQNTGAPLPWEYDPGALGVSSSALAGFNLLADRLGLPPLAADAMTVAAVVGFLVLAALVALLVLKAPRRPRLPQVVLLLLASLVLVVPNYRPEFTLWLLPFVALAYVDWRTFLIWQLTEVLHWWAFWMFIAREVSSGEAEHNIDPLYYVAAVLARLFATAYLMYRTVGHILEPETDPVRRLDIDDPAGGPFNHATDARLRAPVGLGKSPRSKFPAPKDPQ